MIASVLWCDRCYASEGAGAHAAASARDARMARNAGTIRRVRIGRAQGTSGHVYTYAKDLCEPCRAHLDEIRAKRREVVEAIGYIWLGDR